MVFAGLKKPEERRGTLNLFIGINFSRFNCLFERGIKVKQELNFNKMLLFLPKLLQVMPLVFGVCHGVGMLFCEDLLNTKRLFVLRLERMC
jgi:hypothetical protein